MLNCAVLNSVLSTIEHSANKYSAKLYLVHYLAQPNLARTKYVLSKINDWRSLFNSFIVSFVGIIIY